MNIIYHKKVEQSELPSDVSADVYISYIEVEDVNKYAKKLISEISNTSWISELNPVAKMSYEDTAKETIEKLVNIFKSINNNVTQEFGEFMISMSSGHYLESKLSHSVLPLSELWKEKLSNNHGFDFHTLSPQDKFSFGEAKYVSSGNSYTSSAEQVNRFASEGKDKRDAVHLINFSSPTAIKNLENDRKGFIVSFSLNSQNHELILKNSLKNKDIKSLSKICDELYIIGVGYEAS